MPDRDDLDRDILDIIPERFDADADSRKARKSARMRLVLTFSLAVLALAALGVAARHILFGDGPRDRQLSVPVIHAEDKPIRIKPQDRGGMEVPNQDKLIYDKMAAKGPDQQPERLLPPPEQAQLPPAKSAVEPAPAPVPAMTAPASAPTAVASSPLPPPAKTPVPTAPPKAEPVPAIKPAAPINPVAPAPAKTGGWVVQLAALKSEAEAKAEWTRLKTAHGDLLQGLASDILRVDLGAKGIYWRVRGGPLDEAQARLLCAELTKQSQGCLIARK